jgi:hypothetical protein
LPSSPLFQTPAALSAHTLASNSLEIQIRDCWDPKQAKLVQMSFGSYATILAEMDAAGIIEAREAHIDF